VEGRTKGKNTQKIKSKVGKNLKEGKNIRNGRRRSSKRIPYRIDKLIAAVKIRTSYQWKKKKGRLINGGKGKTIVYLGSGGGGNLNERWRTPTMKKTGRVLKYYREEYKVFKSSSKR